MFRVIFVESESQVLRVRVESPLGRVELESSHKKCHWLIAVITWLESTTRITIFRDSDSTRVTLRKIVTRFESESHFSQNDSTWVTINDSSQSHFYTTSEFLMDKPSRLHTKKWGYLASVMMKIGANFLFWLSNPAVLQFKDQVPQLAQK